MEKDEHRLLRTSYRGCTTAGEGLIYTTMNEKNSISKASNSRSPLETHQNDLLSRSALLDQNTWHILPTGISWAPEKIEVNGRPGRRAACLLAQDRLHYRVYDLDNLPDTDEVDQNSEGGSDNAMS